MPQTAIVAISRRGAALARALEASLGGDKILYLEHRLTTEGNDAVAFNLPLRPVIHRLFGGYQALVLFMPVGAAVRLVATCLRDKHADPAVVCVDDAGRFAVSLLSGHVGGADLLTQEVARILGATPVITSASYVTGTLAVDLLGQEFGWQLEADPLAVTRASAAVVNGELVGIYQEAGEVHWWSPDRPLPYNIRKYSHLEQLAEAPITAALIITDRLAPASADGLDCRVVLGNKIVVLYRPRSLVVGMGCRRGVPVEELEQLLINTFQRHNLALASLRCIATAELKRDEPGINQLADRYGVPVHCYGAEDLNRVFEDREGNSPGRRKSPTASPVAHRLLGVWGVSEPAALLASGTQELLVTRQKTARATLAVARMNFAGPQKPPSHGRQS